MTGKASHHAQKRKAEIFKKAHPEGRTIFALKRKIVKYEKKGIDTTSMKARLKRIDRS